MLDYLGSPAAIDSFYAGLSQLFRDTFYWTFLIFSVLIIIDTLVCFLRWLCGLLKAHLQNRKKDR